jgi:4-amino-4-deoxy-L-arabinose transferase-like glycosyltransferase
MRARRSLWLLTLVLLLIAAAALWRIGAQSLWFDEGWSAFGAARPGLLTAAAADATNPPLYYMLLHVTARLWGDSEFGLRVVSLLTGLVGVAVAARWLGERRGRTAALYGALGLASLPLLWWAMREARMYTMLMLLALLAALAFDRLRRKPSRWAWALLIVAELAVLYTHNTGPVVVLWLNILALIAWLGERPMRPRPLPWIASQAAVGVLWLPYFLTRFLALPAANSGLVTTVDLSPGGLFALWQGLWQTPWERVLFGAQPVWPFAAMLALYALVVAARPRASLRPLFHALLLTIGILVGLLLLQNEPHSRYLVLAAPFVALAYGAAVADIHPRMARVLLMIPPLALFTANFIYNVRPDAEFQHDDARAMVRHYAEVLGPGDAVLMWSYADRYELAYYWERLGVAAQRVTLPEGAPRETILPLLPRSGDAAINVWFTQRADYRGMVDCLIADGSAHLPEMTTVHGMSSRLYRDITPLTPDMQPVELVFGRDGLPLAQLEAHGALMPRTADRALCLPLSLRLLAETEVDLKAAVTVLHPVGGEIARADAPFATAIQQTTAQAPADSLFEAYPLLRLPAGTPPGDYPVYVRVYDEVEAPSGYAPLQGGAAVRGRDALLGVWTVLPGADWAGAPLDLPARTPLPAGPDLTLIAHDGVIEGDLPVLRNGDTARLTLLWRGTGVLPALELADTQGRWRVPMFAPEGEHDGLTRDWRAAAIPADSGAGEAAVRLPDGTVIARFTVESSPMSTELPPFATALDAGFEGVGALVGFTLEDGPLSLAAPPQVTLIWRAADEPAETSATVFVQLLDAQGRIMAQSDALPAAGARPTTGWRPGEIVVDRHTLNWNGLAAPGDARLIAGLYDPASGQRVRLADGSDYATLADHLVVAP